MDALYHTKLCLRNHCFLGTITNPDLGVAGTLAADAHAGAHPEGTPQSSGETAEDAVTRVVGVRIGLRHLNKHRVVLNR